MCTKICGGYAKKSSKWFYISAPVFYFTSSCAHQIYFFTRLCCLLLHLNLDLLSLTLVAILAVVFATVALVFLQQW
jgi:hypothetical protein